MDVRKSVENAVSSERAKLPKSEVAYTVHGTDREHCGNCRHYEAAYRCDIVRGDVSPRGWCERWKSS